MPANKLPVIVPSATVDEVRSYVQNPNVLPPPNLKVPVAVLVQVRAGRMSQETGEDVCDCYFTFGYDDLFPITAPTKKSTKKSTESDKSTETDNKEK